MPDIKRIIQNMIDAGEDESSIAAVIRHHESLEPPDRTPAIPPAPYTGDTARRVGSEEPDTFWGGVANSFKSGEAVEAGFKGGLGWLKGAVADLPSTIGGVISDAGEVLSDPLRIAREAPAAFREGLPVLGRQFAETTARAGSNPEEFGRMMGQITGQPLVMEGALAGVGAAGRAVKTPAAKAAYNTGVSGAMERVGGALGGTRTTDIIPTTPRGLAVRGATKAASMAGRPLARAGESIRMRALGIESPVDLTKPVAAGRRNYTGQPNRPLVSEVDPIDPIDIDPIFRKPGPPPSGAAPALIKEANRLTPEEQMAAAIQDVRDRFTREGNPRVEAPPPPFSQGAPAPPEQPRFSVRAPKTKTERPPKTKAEAKNPPTAEKFEPSIDPEFIRAANKDDLRAALERMKAKDAGVDPATGEVIPPKRAKVKWKNPFERLNNETGAIGRDITEIIERQAAEKLAREGAPRPTANMPDWGLETVRAPRPINPLRPEVPPGQVTNRQMFERSDRIAAENRPTPAQKFADEVLAGNEYSEDMLFTPDELRNPDVPVMENSPFENQFDPRITPGGVVSEQAPKFNRVGPGGRSRIDDALNGGRTLPDGQYEIQHPEGFVRLRHDPANPDYLTAHFSSVNEASRGQGIGSSLYEEAANYAKELGYKGVRSTKNETNDLSRGMWDRLRSSGRVSEGEHDLTLTPESKPIRPEDWGDWGGAEKDLPTLINDESGSTVAAPIPKRITPKRSSFSDRARRLLEDETGAVGKDISKIQAKNAANKNPSVGDRNWDVSHPSGKPIGNLTVTRAEIAEARKSGLVPEGMDDVDVSNAMFQQKLEQMAVENGYNINDLNRLRINYNTKAAKEAKAPTTEPKTAPVTKKYDITGKEVKAKDAPKLTDPKPEKLTFDPDRAFEPGGDIQPVAQEASRLEAANAPDASFKKLLPREMQFALGEGETFRDRLTQLINAVTDVDLNPVDMRQVRAEIAAEEVAKSQAAVEAQQMSEINKFLTSIHETMPDSTVPLLDLKKIDFGALSRGKLNQNPREWVSPRLTRQNPAIARKYKGMLDKKK